MKEPNATPELVKIHCSTCGYTLEVPEGTNKNCPLHPHKKLEVPKVAPRLYPRWPDDREFARRGGGLDV